MIVVSSFGTRTLKNLSCLISDVSASVSINLFGQGLLLTDCYRLCEPVYNGRNSPHGFLVQFLSVLAGPHVCVMVSMTAFSSTSDDRLDTLRFLWAETDLQCVSLVSGVMM